MNYIGLKCPICGKAFTADDDIVVCPQCGAPYHRECYAKEGKCIYSELHGTSGTWKPPVRQDSAAEQDDDLPRCPRCGAKNVKNALFCSHCGLPLSPNGPPPYGAPVPGGFAPNGNGRNDSRPQGPGAPGGPFPFQYDPLGGVNPNEPVGGVPASEMAQFIQSNTQYYLPAFINLNRFGKNRFNFSAFLFTGLWMLYRKQYRKGILFTAIPALLWLAYFYICSFLTDPILNKLLEMAGISQSDPFDASQRMALFQQFYALPSGQRLLLLVPNLLLLALFIFKLVIGFGGNRMYLRYCAETTKAIHREASDPTSVSIRMQEKGGINTALAACLAICWFVAFLFLSQSV